jgi:ribonuclease HI
VIWATVITDASYCHKTNRGGWAAWIRIDGRSEPIKKYGSFKRNLPNSTDAEKKAALNGMVIAKAYGADAILLQTDCLSVVHLIDGTTKKRKLIDEWTRYLASCGLLAMTIKGRHVKGHTKKTEPRFFVNRWCDEKANEGRLNYVN